jgi:hypothetical protein
MGHAIKPPDRNLRGWEDVARLYEKRTGERMYRQLAFTIGQRAIRKMRNALIREFGFNASGQRQSAGGAER